MTKIQEAMEVFVKKLQYVLASLQEVASYYPMD
jgi:hypothetical protein